MPDPFHTLVSNKSHASGRSPAAFPTCVFPNMSADAGMPMQLLLRDVVDDPHPTWSDNIDIVQESEELLSKEQTCPNRLKSRLLAQ